MKEKGMKKRVVPPDLEQKKVVRKIDPKQRQEQEELFKQADNISPANKTIDKGEFVQLRDGSTIDLDEYIRDNYTEKSTHFFFETFYAPIADLMGISRQEMKKFKKPLMVPMLKRLLIYGRFPNSVQARLYKKNRYTGYFSRSYWNYQWLTIKADLMLRDFIKEFEDEAERVFMEGGDIKVFITSYSQKFQLSVQLSIFDLN